MKQVPNALLEGAPNLLTTYIATEAQHGLYYLCCLNPANPAYNVSCCYELQGRIDCDALDKSIDAIVARHDALRTYFVPSAEGLEARTYDTIQTQPKILPNLSNADHLHIQTGPLPDNLDTLADDALFNQIINLPFDLETTAPLYRCVLFSSADNEHHRFVFVVHHLVFDYFSKSVFQHELSIFYSHFTNPSTANHPSITEVNYQLKHYAQYKAKQLSAPNFDRQRAHWAKKLLDFSPAYIPTDHLRSEVQDVTGIRVRRKFPGTQIKIMRELTAANQATLFMGMLTIGQLLVSRWTGEADTSVGTHMLDRREPESDKAIGFFLNTLVLRSNFEESVDFIDALKVVRKTCFNAFRFSQVSFERLVESLASERGSLGGQSQTPFFDVRFSHLSDHEHNLVIPGVDVRPTEPLHCRARYDLTLTFHEADEECSLEIEYRTSLFDECTIQWIMDKYFWLLGEITQKPTLPISHMALIQEQEALELLQNYNPAPVSYPSSSSVDQLVSEQAKLTPDKIAIYSDERTVSYAQLESDAYKLCVALINKGVLPGAVIGICMDRSASMMVALLATLKIGAAYLPLDKFFPADRLEYMLSDSQCGTVLIDEATVGVIQSSDCLELRVDELLANTNPTQIKPLKNDGRKSSDIAYLIYTSGSTGKPKGVQVTHSNVVNFLCSMQKTPGISEKDILVAVTTLSFDIAVLELWLPLITGASVVIASKETATQGDQLAKLLANTKASIMQATPVTWRLLLNSGWTGSNDFTALCGGEAMPPDLGQTLSGQCKALWNMYGPTETTVWSCCRKVNSSDRHMSIGYPIDNTDVYVLDRFGHIAYPGTVGHLHIGGAGVSAGYFGKRKLTQQKFIKNPFDSNQIIYATGDSVRYLPDGNLQYIGRTDDQIKLRGYRIELGEIEAQLTAHSAVTQAAATVVQRNNGEAELLAYVEATAADKSELIASLRSALRSKLPSYMVPQRILLVESLPLTPNGKIDKKALPAPEPLAVVSAPQGMQAKTRLEKQLANVWADVLGVDSVPVNETFFDLGGHSLLAMIAIARAKNVMQLEIDPVSMVDSPIRKILMGRDLERYDVIGDAVEDSVQILEPHTQTGFFDNNRLYGRIHRPHRSVSVKGAVLLCNPVFSDANHLHWAYRQLANKLAHEGYVVLRFDYYGCGNSMGEDEEGSVALWQRNIEAAAAYLTNLSNVDSLSVVGFRFGAVLASLCHGCKVDQFVLWEPIFRGVDQVRLLDSKYKVVVESLNTFRPENTNIQSYETAGFSFSAELREDFKSVVFSNEQLVSNCQRVTIVTQKETPDFQPQIDALKKTHSDVQWVYVNDTAPSIDEIDEQAAWLPGKSLNQVALLITDNKNA